MLRDITIGQYYPADSFLHKLDPRTKILLTIGYIMVIFLAKNFFGLVIAALYLASIVKLSKVPLKFILKGLKAIFFILFFTLGLNIFFTRTGNEIVNLGDIIIITTGGVYTAVFMAVRLVFLIIGSSLLTLTTSPIELTDGLERLLRPLKKIKVPAHEIAMMMTIALRFIPILMEETDKIMKAQMARGANFDEGGLVKKAKSMIPLLVPLFISAFRRADDLAMAMEARCYRGDVNRTRMKQLKYSKLDTLAFMGFAGFTLILIISNMVL